MVSNEVASVTNGETSGIGAGSRGVRAFASTPEPASNIRRAASRSSSVRLAPASSCAAAPPRPWSPAAPASQPSRW